jgi:hypothetical protein
MSVVSDVFEGPYALLAKWGVIALLIVSFGAFSWYKGDEHGTEKLTKYVAKQAVEESRIGGIRQTITNQVEAKHAKQDSAVIDRYERSIGLLVADIAAKPTVPVPVSICDDAAADKRLSDAVSAYFERDRQITAGERARVEGLLKQAERQAGQLISNQEWLKAQQKVK